MDLLKKEVRDNTLNYRNALDRIINKYAKIDDAGIDVDLTYTENTMVEHYMDVSKTNLIKLESESLTDVSLRAQDITRDSQLDFSHQDGGSTENSISSVVSTVMSVDDDGESRSDVTQLTVSSLDESQRNFSMMELQPEDNDEELEMILRNHGSSLMDLYPSLISRLERAHHQQCVSNAAVSVLRRYRRLRQQQPNGSYVNNTFIVLRRQSNTKKSSSKSDRNDATCQSPLRGISNQQDCQTQQQSPARVRIEQHQPVLVMDLSGCSDTFKPKEIALNETFNVSELVEQPSTYAVSPSRAFYPTAKASTDQSLRSKRLSLFLSARSPQTDRCSTYESTAVKERADVYSSPVRQSPLKARLMTSLSRSPGAFSQSPKSHAVESFSREPMRPRSMSASLYFSPQRPAVPVRTLHPQDSQTQLHSPPTAAAPAGRHGLRRHLSFDSSLSLRRDVCPSKKLDDDFVKLYHRLVCQNKTSFSNREQQCRVCATGSEASRGQSSSSLAALVLSPHRSLLSKRHRELGWDGKHQSKRFRDESCVSSPGSRRHGNEMLRRRLSASEHEGLSYSPSKRSMLQRFSSQLLSAAVGRSTSGDLDESGMRQPPL